MEITYVYKEMDSPVGRLKLVASLRWLAAVLWPGDKLDRVRVNSQIRDDGHAILLATEKQLGEYFAGTRRAFELPLDFNGSDFQKSVWQALLQIPYGETRSYGQIARQIHRPKACRAVGAANSKNPISIVAACHRVIGASGALTGFAGGIATKVFLLDLESRVSSI